MSRFRSTARRRRPFRPAAPLGRAHGEHGALLDSIRPVVAGLVGAFDGWSPRDAAGARAGRARRNRAVWPTRPSGRGRRPPPRGAARARRRDGSGHPGGVRRARPRASARPRCRGARPSCRRGRDLALRTGRDARGARVLPRPRGQPRFCARACSGPSAAGASRDLVVEARAVRRRDRQPASSATGTCSVARPEASAPSFVGCSSSRARAHGRHELKDALLRCRARSPAASAVGRGPRSPGPNRSRTRRPSSRRSCERRGMTTRSRSRGCHFDWKRTTPARPLDGRRPARVRLVPAQGRLR